MTSNAAAAAMRLNMVSSRAPGVHESVAPGASCFHCWAERHAPPTPPFDTVDMTMSTPRSTLLAAIMPIAAVLGVVTATTDTGLLSVAAAQTSAAHRLSVVIENGKANSGTVRVVQGEQVE